MFWKNYYLIHNYVTLNLFQGRKSVLPCDAESISARRTFRGILFILLINTCLAMPSFAGNGITSQKRESVDELMPYPPYPTYSSGVKDSDNAIYRYAHKTSDYPNLMLIEPLYDNEGNVILPGYYSLVLSDDRSILYLVQGEKIYADIPVFKVEEDKKAVEKLRDKKYQKKLAKQAKKEAKSDAKRAKQGIPPQEKTVHMDAGIEYQTEGKYYLIKYERDRIRAWGAISE